MKSTELVCCKPILEDDEEEEVSESGEKKREGILIKLS